MKVKINNNLVLNPSGVLSLKNGGSVKAYLKAYMDQLGKKGSVDMNLLQHSDLLKLVDNQKPKSKAFAPQEVQVCSNGVLKTMCVLGTAPVAKKEVGVKVYTEPNNHVIEVMVMTEKHADLYTYVYYDGNVFDVTKNKKHALKYVFNSALDNIEILLNTVCNVNYFDTDKVEKLCDVQYVLEEVILGLGL